MKHIIIDTNVVHLDYQLTGVRITGLCSSCERLDHRVFIPEVVIDEMVKQYRDEVNECTEQINNALNKLKKRNVQIQLQSIDSALITSGYERKLRDRINILGIHVIPYPKTTHKEMVARELNRRKPFKDSTKGYRHNEQSVRVADVLENLNLCQETVNGILTHSWGLKPLTLEAQVVQIAHKVYKLVF